jgi:hypothetical protein
MTFGKIGSGLFFFITKLELLITEIRITECHRTHNGFVATQTIPKSANVINDIVPMESLASAKLLVPGRISSACEVTKVMVSFIMGNTGTGQRASVM